MMFSGPWEGKELLKMQGGSPKGEGGKERRAGPAGEPRVTMDGHWTIRQGGAGAGYSMGWQHACCEVG